MAPVAQVTHGAEKHAEWRLTQHMLANALTSPHTRALKLTRYALTALSSPRNIRGKIKEGVPPPPHPRLSRQEANRLRQPHDFQISARSRQQAWTVPVWSMLTARSQDLKLQAQQSLAAKSRRDSLALSMHSE
jgi:hypothetical protein